MTHDPKTPPNYGPDIRQTEARGRVAGWVRDRKGAPVTTKHGKRKPLVVALRQPDVEIEVRPDIDDAAKNKRTILGARRRDGLMMMFRKGQLTASQMAAADVFRDDLAITAGARLGMPHEAQSVRARRQDFHPGQRQLEAQTRCKAAWLAMTPLQRPVVSWVVISWGTIGGYADCKRMRPERAAARLLDALDVLADFYTAISAVDAGQRTEAKSV